MRRDRRDRRADRAREVAANIPGTVAIRDSKTPDGPILRVPVPSWAAFTSGVVSAGLARSGRRQSR
ncbi:DUF397 domain-containing protein [Streptomyces xinghaiensis]|uniref:DUF397 domain-containing protein n=1 Tax=Streptomyces xinghaiensis TaxID=1038928 RepID=A0A420V920_9ACTN|nr:DUF397 domain-containing protein [Streptomyces xinghaiensis]RKM98854.1 DUF397 domain-containing protein [Streptomyces xinghaiensis]RNC76245.1 DUF397 domain-containing protein [Streptomyces xinghaiensis]